MKHLVTRHYLYENEKIIIRRFVMKAILSFLLVLLASTATAQESYKCNVGGAMVYQDSPCNGSARRSDSMPQKQSSSGAPVEIAAPESEVIRQRAKIEKDKEYIDQRVKARNFEREKDLAVEQLRNCYSEIDAIQYQINQIANSAPQGAPLDRASAINLQLDQQRRQTDIAALQSQAANKRSECDIRRDEFNRLYRK